ncbi:MULTISPECIES: hypothetical protein [Cyanophyceae]|uniref:hypothetical protein n=1 Tax=Cyanophyceae TaxID=3028117 RepID=UPI0016888E81|nr:hypothetical protein [Trichocoleus sp. FACHB-832]MBD1908343.1 hypothetical protein [Trichocoleus sp. FACHB-832]
MNLKIVMFCAFGLGVIGSAVGTAGYFDGKLIYCQPTANGCVERSVPDWIKLNSSARNVRREPGAAGWKLSGAFVSVAGFWVSMTLARSLATQEEKQHKYQRAWEAVSFQKLRIQMQAELEAYNQQAMIQAAELSYSVLEPYDQPLFDGTNALDISNRIEATSTTETQPLPKPPNLITTLEQSEVAPILLAGFAKAIGGQGSGKTTLVNGGFIRYRVHKKHKFIIINAHKKHGMYRGLEPHLVPGTKFYGVGANNKERGQSIREGMEKVLLIVESRYAEYQNQPEGTYEHYPITLILEECGEWASLLEGDKKFVQAFWQKMLVACRKAVVFPIVTAQHDSMTMFGNPEGLSELLKSNGCVTLHLIPQVDPKSADGWKPSGFGDLVMPGSDEKQRITIPDLRSLVGNPDVFDSGSDRPAKTVEDISPDALWEAARERLNQVWQMPTTPEPSEPSPEPLNQPNCEGSSDSDKRFTPLNLTREQALELIQSLNPELNQTQTIERLWRVKKGGSAAWKEAYAQFKELTGGGDD